MNAASKAMLWAIWARCAAIYREQGMKPKDIDEKRRRVTANALGYPLSMSAWKRWKVAEVTKVKQAFMAICEPTNLGAQMKAEDGKEQHRGKIFAACWNLTEEMVKTDDLMGDRLNYQIEKYLDSICRSVGGKMAQHCDAEVLAKVRGILTARIESRNAAALKPGQDTPF